jgi:N-acetylglucosaminyldiphosphoundecaprenol N-acetyl-beta-D-mannosaminyltransferase
MTQAALLFPPTESSEIAFPRKFDLFGIQVSATHYREVVERLLEAARRGVPAIVDFAPANVIVEGTTDPIFGQQLNGFDILCPDGQPVRWCLNHFHKAGLKDRVYGPFLMLQLCQAAAREGMPIYLYGATPETLAKLQQSLAERCPNLRIAGAESPPFRPLTAAEDDAAVERINTSGARFLFLGIGSPRQERFASAHRGRIGAVQLCVGAAFDFLAGTKKMAPRWMQKCGLEWLFRLGSEPGRLGKRYFVGNSRFLLLVTRRQFLGPR